MSAHATTRLATLARRLLWGGLVVLSAIVTGRLEAQISPGPLARAHRELEGATNCAQCHGLRREPMSRMCASCHRDIGTLVERGRGYHGLEGKASKRECAQCHPDHAGAAFEMIEWPGGSPAKFDHRKAGWTLEGAHLEARCETCHAGKYRTSPVAGLSKRKSAAGWVGLETSCASCHREDDVHKGDLGVKCEGCHDSKRWTSAPGFDHAASDYPLTGKHADVECAKCHVTPRLPVRLNADGERVGTFKPVPFRECSSCHTDAHRGALGAKCGECHVTRGFQVIDQEAFNHQATRFPLRGKHASATCEGCHGARLAVRRPASGTCAACHQDVHDGEATLAGKAADCASCHGVNGFAPSTFSVAQHRQTAYPLDGRHVGVKCARCHVPSPAANRTTGRAVARLHPAATTCAACHRDAHAGELSTRPDAGACEGCHTTSGFAPSSFGSAAHAKLKVTLEGRHGAVACAACHGPVRDGLPALPAPATRTAKLTLALRDATCASCHVDPHAGRYGTGGRLALTGSCSSCHGAAQWRPATMTSATHDQFSFKLEGAHRAVPCVGCHQELGARPASSTLALSPRGVAALPFTSTREATCASCHETPHGSQFAGRRDAGRCDACHTVATFAPAGRFDHERDARFSLKGAHARVACASCHQASPGGGIAYRPLSGKCESCHAPAGARRTA